MCVRESRDGCVCGSVVVVYGEIGCRERCECGVFFIGWGKSVCGD